MYYDIIGLCPRTDLRLGAHGFSIHLHPKWKGLVAASKLTHEDVTGAIKSHGNLWLDACGYGRRYGDEKLRAYEARTSVRVSWGEWGPEHITVPGNACGLDLTLDSLGNPLGGPSLDPHNIDNWSQVQLLLVVFTFFAESLVILAHDKIRSGEV